MSAQHTVSAKGRPVEFVVPFQAAPRHRAPAPIPYVVLAMMYVHHLLAPRVVTARHRLRKPQPEFLLRVALGVAAVCLILAATGLLIERH